MLLYVLGLRIDSRIFLMGGSKNAGIISKSKTVLYDIMIFYDRLGSEKCIVGVWVGRTERMGVRVAINVGLYNYFEIAITMYFHCCLMYSLVMQVVEL